MASDIYNSIGANQLHPQPQNPKDQALERMRQMGFQIPQGAENDPGTLIRMVMQSGMVPQNRLALSQNVLSRLMGGR